MKKLSIIGLTSILFASKAFAGPLYTAGEITYNGTNQVSTFRFVFGGSYGEFRAEADIYSTSRKHYNTRNSIYIPSSQYGSSYNSYDIVSVKLYGSASMTGFGVGGYYDFTFWKRFILSIGARLGYAALDMKLSGYTSSLNNYTPDSITAKAKLSGLETGVSVGFDYRFTQRFKLGLIVRADTIANPSVDATMSIGGFTINPSEELSAFLQTVKNSSIGLRFSYSY